MDRMMRIGWMMAGLVFMACSSEEEGNPRQTPEPENPSKYVVNIVTRTLEREGNGTGLQAGLYMVNCADGQQTALLSDNNYVNNLLMNYSSGAWVTSQPICWQDANVNADFYAYAPYRETVDNARAMSFRVATDQTTEDAFQKSDLLWGCVLNQSPVTEGFSLILRHQLSQLTVSVTPGAGFSEGEMTADMVTVTIGGSKTHGTVDLQNGVVTATDEVADVKCRNNGDLTYTAILLPQQIAFVNLIHVNWNGNVYTLQNSFLLEARKQYQLTIKLNKAQGGLDIGISGWDIIGEDFGGTVG